MKIVLFAGGSGRRLWPISRQQLPKQFEPIVGDKSTVQLAYDRLRGAFGPEDVLISTNARYLDILRRQLPDLPADSFIGEPERRDLAAAVGLAMMHVRHRFGPEEPVAIVWADNYMDDTVVFLDILDAAEDILGQRIAEMVFIGETPRFANDNLGWIGLGKDLGRARGRPFFGFESWIYRPELNECRRMFAEGGYVWNTGYFVTTAGFVLDAYQRFKPEIWQQLAEIGRTIGKTDYEDVLQRIYPSIEVASFDDAIVQHIERDRAVVIHGRMGWSDPGTLYALKEAINPDTASNVEKGLVKALQSKDCLLYNYESDKVLAAVGLEGMIVVNMPDALLVVHKDDIGLVKKFVNSLAGTELERYS